MAKSAFMVKRNIVPRVCVCVCVEECIRKYGYTREKVAKDNLGVLEVGGHSVGGTGAEWRRVGRSGVLRSL